MTKQREASSDVLLSEDVSHVDALPKGKDFMEVNGLIVRGEAEGMEVCLEAMLWHFGGGRRGQWRVDEAVAVQTNFHMAPKGQAKVGDNEFISNRVDPTEWPGTLEIEQKPDRNIWRAGNRQWISRPPYWQVKGEHMGVDLDLTLGGMGHASRVYGPWETLAETGRAGYENCCWAEGTITVKGRKYTLENGWGDHGVLTFGEGYQQVEGMRPGYYFVWAWHRKMQIFFWVQPGSGIGSGFAYTDDGREFKFGPGQIRVSPLERWTDPVTSMDVPVRWHVNMNAPGMIADFVIDGQGRGIFCLPTNQGITARYSFSARANGQAFFATGENIELKDMTSFVQWGKSVLPLPGAAPSVD